MTNLNSMLNSRDITLPTKIHMVKPCGLPNGHIHKEESRTIKKAERQRIDAFESPLDSEEIKPVNLKGNQP